MDDPIAENAMRMLTHPALGLQAASLRTLCCSGPGAESTARLVEFIGMYAATLLDLCALLATLSGRRVDAERLAAELGAAPLPADVEALARRTGPASTSAARTAVRGAPSLARFGLTRREREVLDLLAAGQSNPQIGAELFISPKTASVHVSNILAKLGVSGRGEAAALVHRLSTVDR